MARERRVTITGEHENRIGRKLEAIDEQELHALSVIDAASEFLSGVPVGYPANHGFLATVDSRGLTLGSMVVRRRRRRWMIVWSRWLWWWWWRDPSWVGDEGDGMADDASDGLSTLWKL